MKVKPIRMIIADDHEVLREGLAALLQDDPSIEIVAQASNGRDAVDLAHEFKPDIVLLDITMDEMTGLEAIRHLQPDTRVIFLTMHIETEFFFEALRLGAHGYFLKGSHTDELIGAIHAVHKGGVYLPPQLAGNIVSEFLGDLGESPLDKPSAPSLTRRENEIVVLIAQGLSNREIANKLNISINTIKTHRANIYQKLNLSDRTSLVNYALQVGLLHASN